MLIKGISKKLKTINNHTNYKQFFFKFKLVNLRSKTKLIIIISLLNINKGISKKVKFYITQNTWIFKKVNLQRTKQWR